MVGGERESCCHRSGARGRKAHHEILTRTRRHVERGSGRDELELRVRAGNRGHGHRARRGVLECQRQVFRLTHGHGAEIQAGGGKGDRRGARAAVPAQSDVDRRLRQIIRADAQRSGRRIIAARSESNSDRPFRSRRNSQRRRDAG